MSGGMFTPIMPFFPDLATHVMPVAPLNAMIRAFTQRFKWMKSHPCACRNNNRTQPGSPVPTCVTCQGRGYWWDPPSQEFMAGLTYVHISPTPDEPGATMSEKWGLAEQSQPLITIPSDADADGTIWANAAKFDAFIWLDGSTRYDVDLVVGQVQAVPYQQNLSIAPTGAVTVWNQATSGVVTGVPYTVSGASVFLGPEFGPGTNYVVEFTASPVFEAFRDAGAQPHARPFGGGPSKYPRRFRLQQLDRWTRAAESFPYSTSPQSLGANIPV